MRISHALIICLVAAGCGMPGAGSYESLLSLQPYVVSVEPVDGSMAAERAAVAVEFSRPVAPDTVGPFTLAIVKDEGKDAAEVVDELMDKDIEGAEGVYEFAGEGRVAVFRPALGYEPGAGYLIIASTAIQSVEGLPLNQSAGSSPAPFVSAFKVSGVDGSESSASTGAGGDGGESIERVRPSFLMINEVMYDAIGSDTNGDVFVELLGESGGDISDYKILFINGEDGAISDTIELPEGALVGDDGIYLIADAKTGEPGVSNVEGAELVLNFDPQNGPDCIQLLDAEGLLLDSLGYGSPLVSLATNGLACHEGGAAMDVASGISLSRSGGVDTGENQLDFQPMDIPSPGIP
ncbi:MAG: hypothetical protein WC683_05670 [bacterium]